MTRLISENSEKMFENIKEGFSVCRICNQIETPLSNDEFALLSVQRNSDEKKRTEQSVGLTENFKSQESIKKLSSPTFIKEQHQKVGRSKSEKKCLRKHDHLCFKIMAFLQEKNETALTPKLKREFLQLNLSVDKRILANICAILAISDEHEMTQFSTAEKTAKMGNVWKRGSFKTLRSEHFEEFIKKLFERKYFREAISFPLARLGRSVEKILVIDFYGIGIIAQKAKETSEAPLQYVGTTLLQDNLGLERKDCMFKNEQKQKSPKQLRKDLEFVSKLLKKTTDQEAFVIFLDCTRVKAFNALYHQQLAFQDKEVLKKGSDMPLNDEKIMNFQEIMDDSEINKKPPFMQEMLNFRESINNGIPAQDFINAYNQAIFQSEIIKADDQYLGSSDDRVFEKSQELKDQQQNESETVIEKRIQQNEMPKKKNRKAQMIPKKKDWQKMNKHK